MCCMGGTCKVISIKLTQNMSLIYSEWLAILLFIVVSIGLSGVLFGLSYAFIHQNPDLEKTSAYECGFNPFEDARNKFDVRFYVVAILFIIFDLEVIFLCPWSLVYGIDSLGFYQWCFSSSKIGFVFEWQKDFRLKLKGISLTLLCTIGSACGCLNF